MDDVLPLVMEISKNDKNRKITFHVESYKHLLHIRESIFLPRFFKEINANLIGKNSKNQNLFRITKILFYIRKLFSTRTKIITYQPSSRLLKIYLKINKTFTSSKSIQTLLVNASYDQALNIDKYHDSIRGYRKPKEEYYFFSNKLLLSHSYQDSAEIFNLVLPNKKNVFSIGTTRYFDSWKNFIEKSNIQKYQNKKIFYLPLTATKGHIVHGERAPEFGEKLESLIKVLSNYNKSFHLVMRPHHKTDLSIVKNLLNKYNFTDYSFSENHNFELINYCDLVVSYHATSVFIDAWMMSKPVIEHSIYDERFSDLNNQKPRYLDAVTCFTNLNESVLEKVIILALKNKLNPKPKPKKLVKSSKEDFMEFLEYIKG